MSEKMMYGASLKGFRSVLADKLVELGGKYKNMVVIDAETGTATNILDFRKAYPDRFVTTGIAEQAAMSFASSLSRAGKISVIPLFSCFLSRRACDQIYVQIGYSKANVKMIGCYSGITTPNTGATHQSVNDIAIIRSMPNIVVVETADPGELGRALEAAMEYRGPVFIRMIRGDIAPYDAQCVPDNQKFSLFKSTVLREGKDISLIASGMMVPRALEAADILGKKGIDAEVVNCSAIKPVDKETIVASAKKTGRVVTCENNNIYGGVGSAVAECLSQYCPVPMRFVGIEDDYGWSGDLADLCRMFGLTTDKILEKAGELLG
ncbi:MAG: transketolase family protein [Treponema sp.]|nr:transketolase family protein [Treponema sp.]